MDGHSNSATLADRPAFRRNQGDRDAPFRDRVQVNELNCLWSDEPSDGFYTTQNPLSVAGFIRLGGLNPSSSTARKNGKRCSSSQQIADVVLPRAHSKSSFRLLECSADLPRNEVLAAESPSHPAASSALIAANSLPENEMLGNTPEASDNATTGGVEEEATPELTDAGSAEPLFGAAELRPFEQLQALSKRVKAGDDLALAEIQQILDGNDALWRQLGDVEKTTEAMLIEFAEGTTACKESVRRSVAAMKQSLHGAQPTPLERMAVGRVVSCWLFAHFVDRWCGWSIKQNSRANDMARLLEAAEKRYQTSLKSLKLVQEIKLPTERSGRSKSAAA
jgi:hypothetical protein